VLDAEPEYAWRPPKHTDLQQAWPTDQMAWAVVAVEDHHHHYPKLCPSADCVTSAEVQ